MTWVFKMKQKYEAFIIFKHWTFLMKNQSEKIVKCLITNNGLKFCTTEFNEFCRDKGITRQCTTNYTLKQNEVAKKMNKTLLEKAKCMLSNLGLNKSF